MAKMPAFSLPSSAGGTLGSRDLKGTPYVLFFYPKDLTPGCTIEACDFRDAEAGLRRKGVRVIGVSADDLTRHARFVAKHDLGFPLLADVDHVLAERLGVWQEKAFMGRRFLGIVRSTFLVDADGSILREWRGVKVKGHVEEVIEAVDELLGGGSAAKKLAKTKKR